MYRKLFHYGTYILLNANSGVTFGHRIYSHTEFTLKVIHIIKSRSLAYLIRSNRIVIVIVAVIFNDIIIIIISNSSSSSSSSSSSRNSSNSLFYLL
jgi:uncharacterized protein (DUF2062 family)